MLTAIYKDGDAKAHRVLVTKGSKADKHWRELGYGEPVEKASKPAATKADTKPADNKTTEPTPTTTTTADQGTGEQKTETSTETKGAETEVKPQTAAKPAASPRKK